MKKRTAIVKKINKTPPPVLSATAQAAACICYHTCGTDSKSGDWHQHEDEPCPTHPEAEMVG